MKINKIGKTRKGIRWKRREFVVVEKMRKQSESEDGGMRELRERVLRFLRLENTPEGRVVSLLLLRDEEQMRMRMSEGKEREME